MRMMKTRKMILKVIGENFAVVVVVVVVAAAVDYYYCYYYI